MVIDNKIHKEYTCMSSHKNDICSTKYLVENNSQVWALFNFQQLYARNTSQ